MTPQASLVLVSFRSSRVLPAAVESFRSEARRAGLSAEVVVVDHSGDPAEHAALAEARPDVVMTRPNRGYAAGINAGTAAARGAILLVGNPDIVFQEGSLAALLSARERGWDVVGPQFTLGRFALPPADAQGPEEEVRRWLASRTRVWWRAYLLREAARWDRVWSAMDPVGQKVLSGALVVCRRDALASVGPWDERYFLYFEENDWFGRAVRAGLKIARVPRARVTHSWAHSASPSTHGEHFLRSRRLFYTQAWPLLGRASISLRAGTFAPETSPLPDKPGRVPAERVLWLVSPSPRGYPAGGMWGPGEVPVDALRELAALRGEAARYTLFGVEPATRRMLGSWHYDFRR